jgi:transcriptional regulator with XRE-family HTH domain
VDLKKINEELCGKPCLPIKIFHSEAFFCYIYSNMVVYNAEQFWLRYKRLAGKDFPVTLKTKISPSTLSTWKNKGIYPRADSAYQIANTLNTTVEYLVTGERKINPAFSSSILEIVIAAEQLTEEDRNTLKYMANHLKERY